MRRSLRPQKRLTPKRFQTASATGISVWAPAALPGRISQDRSEPDRIYGSKLAPDVSKITKYRKAVSLRVSRCRQEFTLFG
jgi:hypothetical protein